MEQDIPLDRINLGDVVTAHLRNGQTRSGEVTALRNGYLELVPVARDTPPAHARRRPVRAVRWDRTAAADSAVRDIRAALDRAARQLRVLADVPSVFEDGTSERLAEVAHDLVDIVIAVAAHREDEPEVLELALAKLRRAES